MKIEIDTNEKIAIYAISAAGWGRGDTIGQAMENMRKMSRGYIADNYCMKDLDGKKLNCAQMIEDQQISIYASNEVDGIEVRHFSPVPSKGKWVLHLGDVYNSPRFIVGE